MNVISLWATHSPDLDRDQATTPNTSYAVDRFDFSLAGSLGSEPRLARPQPVHGRPGGIDAAALPARPLEQSEQSVTTVTGDSGLSPLCSVENILGGS